MYGVSIIKQCNFFFFSHNNVYINIKYVVVFFFIIILSLSRQTLLYYIYFDVKRDKIQRKKKKRSNIKRETARHIFQYNDDDDYNASLETFYTAKLPFVAGPRASPSAVGRRFGCNAILL